MDLGGENLALNGQESVSDCAERDVMVKTAPGASLEVVEAYLLLQLLVVALDAPTEFHQTDQFASARGG